jgi:hypothetical protein
MLSKQVDIFCSQKICESRQPYWNYSGIGYPGIIPELLFWNYYGFGYSRISTITWRRGAAAYTNARIAIPE